MAGPRQAGRLLVEGAEDKRMIPELMEADGITWEYPSGPVVDIKDCGGLECLLDVASLSAELKASDRRQVGIIVDADESPGDRWRKIRDALLKIVPGIPDDLPRNGLVHPCRIAGRPLKIGVWMMPDNSGGGSLETFLGTLTPPEQIDVWRWAERACTEARKLGAPFKERHREKARIHTWLSVQDPPGQQMHNAVAQRILQPGSPNARSFVSWFRELFEL